MKKDELERVAEDWKRSSNSWHKKCKKYEDKYAALKDKVEKFLEAGKEERWFIADIICDDARGFYIDETEEFEDLKNALD